MKRNLHVIRQRKQLYDALERSSEGISESVERAVESGNTSALVEDMKNFNKAFGYLVREEAMIKNGLENIDVEAIETIGQEIDDLAPMETTWADLIPGGGALMGAIGTYGAIKYATRKVRKAFDWLTLRKIRRDLKK